jgi:hypothetical protein
VRRATARDLTAAGVRTESDAEYRRERVDWYASQMADRSPAKLTELERFLDSWLILEIDGPAGPAWLPTPGWDGDATRTRDSYPTIGEAKAAIASVGGALRPGRGHS